MDISELPTPALVVDIKKVERNAKEMLERAEQFKVKLRPHFKTAKVAKIAELQTDGTKRRMVVSTLAEAEYLADNEFDDILYGVPITKDKIKRFIEISKKLSQFHALIDDKNILQDLEQNSLDGDKEWSLFVEIDPGYHRSGVYDIEEIVSLAKKITASTKSNFQGIYTHCGHSYHCTSAKEIKKVGADVTSRLLEIVERLKSEGIECCDYGLGSTPSCSQPDESLSKLTEWHPGNYIFYDTMQEKIGSCSRDKIACFVITRISNHYSVDHDHMSVDCGWTAFETQGFGEIQQGGYSCIVDHPELRLSRMTQEHGIITAADGGKIDFEKYPKGTILKILPYHSCATCCLHPFYYIMDENGKIIDKVCPVKGW